MAGGMRMGQVGLQVLITLCTIHRDLFEHNPKISERCESMAGA